MSTVLVTGGSGLVGSHCIVQLLKAGHTVRTTVRSLKREHDVRSMIAEGGATGDQALSFFAANLEEDAGWPDAVAGCDYVLHVASPFPAVTPANEEELIGPARNGTLRVLRAACEARVKRVVLTSSFAAVGYGHEARRGVVFTENDWTEISDSLPAYIKSKTIAERAAWDFVAHDGGALELSVINPVGIFGPVLGLDYSSSVALVKRMLDGAMSGFPQLYFGAVDVRDVADLHIRAMTNAAANGERFLAVAGNFMSMRDMGLVLKQRLSVLARRVPTRQLPNWMVRLAAIRNTGLKASLPELGNVKNASNEKAKRVLGWLPRSNEECLVATAESLATFGLVKAS